MRDSYFFAQANPSASPEQGAAVSARREIGEAIFISRKSQHDTHRPRGGKPPRGLHAEKSNEAREYAYNAGLFTAAKFYAVTVLLWSSLLALSVIGWAGAWVIGVNIARWLGA